jgi:serine protease Do
VAERCDFARRRGALAGAAWRILLGGPLALACLPVLPWTAGVATASPPSPAPASTAAGAAEAPAAASTPTGIDTAQPKMVKLYGAGGFEGLEAYQSGFLISAEGHILTAWSYVLDTDYLAVMLADGRKLEAKLVGADPRLEIAVLKIDAQGLDHFDLAHSAAGEVGTRVWALSNLFGVATGDEANSVQHGVVAAKTQLDARRGVYETPYHGPVYVVDCITNNPGAAGGALVNFKGELLGMLGKELRNSQNNVWLNYAIPLDQFATSVDDIIAGKTHAVAEKPASPAGRDGQGVDLNQRGVVMVPDVLERTPPYIEQVRAHSAGAAAGLHADDLVVCIGDHLVQSLQALFEELKPLDPGDELRLLVRRDQELIEVILRPAPDPAHADSSP